ncbi:MAG: PDDEXK nuclease domain-containing protein [Lentimicrobiaceae bacterium]|nr:PDDEXK nuclease domain-containing protein [Lentimicrobiaceae bacterium]
MNEIIKLSEYSNWLRDLKQQIKTGQIKAALSVNSQMIMLYWDLGRQISEKQEKSQWGSGFIEQLSKDLREEFPEMTGFSYNNLLRMKNFYQFYLPATQYDEFIPQAVGQINNTMGKQILAQVVPKLQQNENQQDIIWKQVVSKLYLIPWGHHIKIMQKLKDPAQALFYINKTIENNWSRAVLEYQIESNLYGRQGKAITNFSLTLPAPQSDLANEIMKSPYNFDFLCMSEKVKEIDLEKALVQHISHFLPELGIGFAYMGRQFTLKVGDDEYRTDLLFYHTKLKCYVIIELKTKKFEPEFVGKLNFYITALNELVKDGSDNPTIGMLLCKDKNNYAVEFSLKDIHNPVGVSTFHYTELADDIKSALPSAEKLQNELLNFEREHSKK